MIEKSILKDQSNRTCSDNYNCLRQLLLPKRLQCLPDNVLKALETKSVEFNNKSKWKKHKEINAVNDKLLVVERNSDIHLVARTSPWFEESAEELEN